MAKSPSHRLGQTIGNLLEAAMYPSLVAFCEEHGYFLDRHDVRPASRP